MKVPMSPEVERHRRKVIRDATLAMWNELRKLDRETEEEFRRLRRHGRRARIATVILLPIFFAAVIYLLIHPV